MSHYKPNNGPAHPINYLSGIQGLRAVAVILVVFYHSGLNAFSFGYIGVDIFFVISGYLITGTLVKKFEGSQGFRFWHFVSRRILRLIPSAAVVFITTIFIAWITLPPLEIRLLAYSAVSSAIYLSNLWFAWISTDYFNQETLPNLFLHTWTLSLEVQFYLIWAVLFLIFIKMGSVTGLRKRLVTGTTIISLISFSVFLLLSNFNPVWAFFSFPSRIWEFSVGALIALLSINKKLSRPYLVDLIGLAGIIMILFIASVSHTDKNTVGAYMMLPVFGASFVIITAQSKYTSIVNRWLSIKPLQFIGNLSYSLYLWHWPIFIFIGVKITDTNIFVSFAGFAVSLVLAFVTYHFVENPIRYNRFLSQNLFASIGLGILLTVLVSGISLFIFTVNKKMIAQSRHQIYFDSLKQSSKLYAENCHAKFFDIKSKKCVFGDLTSNTTVVLFGDSHAANWFPALELIALREGWRLVPLTKTSCPAVSYEPFHKKRYRAYTECTQWREWAFQRISELNPYLTIISSTNSYLFSTPRNEEKQKPRIWQESMNTTLKRLEKISDFTVLIHDTPRLPFSAPKCLSRALWQGTTPEATCVFDVRPSKHDPFYNAEMVAITGIERTFLIDMNDIICPTSPCRVYQDGMILFSDKHHLTVNFSRSLSAQLMARLHLFLPSTPKKGQ